MTATEATWAPMKQCRFGRLQESIKGCNRFNYLSDELVMRILCRLPNCKSVIVCKCVCKHWAALVSDPWFISQFIGLNFGDDVRFAIIMWYKPNRFRSLWDGSESFFKPSIFDARDSSFSPFHGLEDVNASATLVASCNDLVLYSKHEQGKKYELHISNVQTRQWVELPSPPCDRYRFLQYGLIYNPLHSYAREIAIYVVLIPCYGRPLQKWGTHVFSFAGHGGHQWCSRVLTLPKKCKSMGPGVSSFCFDWKVCFPCFDGIIGFDQNRLEFDDGDDEIQCHLVKWPVMSLGPERVGVSQGNLTVSHLDDDTKLRVWVLKDYNTSNWVLRYEIRIQDWVSRESWITEALETFSQMFIAHVDVLGFHPSNLDIIYMLVPGSIFICNLSTKTLGLACSIPAAVAKVAINAAPSSKHYLGNPMNFLVMLSSWPTPLRMATTPL